MLDFESHFMHWSSSDAGWLEDFKILGGRIGRTRWKLAFESCTFLKGWSPWTLIRFLVKVDRWFGELQHPFSSFISWVNNFEVDFSRFQFNLPKAATKNNVANVLRHLENLRARNSGARALASEVSSELRRYWSSIASRAVRFDTIETEKKFCFVPTDFSLRLSCWMPALSCHWLSNGGLSQMVLPLQTRTQRAASV